LKTLVFNKVQNTRIPFLRGILIGSLQDAGLTFDEAYEVATGIRTKLGDRPEITTDELREWVAYRLRGLEDTHVLEQYATPHVAPGVIVVRRRDGSESPFSRGRHQRYLLASGLRPEPAQQVTELIYDQLLAANVAEISSCELGYLTWLCLRQEVGAKSAQRYLTWSEFQRSNRPLFLLIGGAVGSGKSTLATEMAHRMEIVRVQSTDMLREVMRMMLPMRLLPMLHLSSYDAWQALPAREADTRDRDQLVAEGYQMQAKLLAVPCEAFLQRASTEGVSFIMEGVHAHPDMAASLADNKDVIVVSLVLAVLNSDELKSRLRGRGAKEPARGAKSYLESFDSIWRLQSYLLSEADRCEIPIIANDDRERAKREIARTIIARMGTRLSGSPRDVFGPVVHKGKEPGWRDVLLRLVA